MLRVVSIGLLCLLLPSCGVLYVPQALERPVEVVRDAAAVDVQFTALGEEVVRRANEMPFERRIVQGSDLDGPARFLTETDAIRERLPADREPGVYRIGVGDVLTFSRIGARLSGDGERVDGVLTRELPVLPGGYISLLEVGRVYVEDLTIRDAQDSVSEAMLRAGEDPRFELSISGFNSQKVLVGGEVSEPGAYPITSRPMRLSELLLIAGVGNGTVAMGDVRQAGGTRENPIYLVRLLRGNAEYRSSVERILKGRGTGAVYLKPDDKILVERLTYRPEHVLIAGEVREQQLYPISADTRPSLATALYGTGAIDLEKSNPAEIYLFRGRGPVMAYHLDASDPLRLSLASEFELRPDDIVFIAAQPLTNYNRTLRRLLGTYELSNVVEN